MQRTPKPFDFTHHGLDILYGRDRVSELEDILAGRNLNRAMIVCGSNVGGNDALMNPIISGLGDRYAGTFDETTPAKRIETAFDAIERRHELDADVLIGVGGGSSLDVARQMTVLEADSRSEHEIVAAGREGSLSGFDHVSPEVPIVVIPTTFAGADVSNSGSLVVVPAEDSPTGQPVTMSGTAMPIADLADPSLFETTPFGTLEGSAMNGFNKGIETLYARDSTPFSDSTAIHGLRYLQGSFPRLSVADPIVLDRAVLGMLLVQYERKASLIHAFGHAFARRYPVQQGAVHAVMVLPALRHVLEHVDGLEAKFAEAFGIDLESVSDPVEKIVAAVAEIRDGLSVPRSARELPETKRADVPALAEFVMNDRMISQVPEELDLRADAVEMILNAAW